MWASIHSFRSGCSFFVGDIVGFCEAVEEFIAGADVLADEHARISEETALFLRNVYFNEPEGESSLSAINRFLGGAN